MLALMISLIAMLCGCSSTKQLEGDYAAWQEEFLSKAEHNITAEVTGVIEDTHCEFTLLYHANAQEETVEVLAPELIANVKAHMSADGSRLSFDGVMLETGEGIDSKLSPLTALPMFMRALREGHLEALWTETFNGAVTLVSEHEMPDGSKMTLWQDSFTLKPVFATLRSGTVVEIKISLTDLA